jgi:coronin-1B/1C/6
LQPYCAGTPFDDNVVVSGGEDGKMLIWKVEADAFEGWGVEKWVPQDFEPVMRIDALPRKVRQILFHPAAKHVLVSAFGDHTVKLCDLGNTDAPHVSLGEHGSRTLICKHFVR